LHVSLGDLVADQEVSLVVAVAFKGAQHEGASIGVKARVGDRGAVLPSHPMAVRWEAVDSIKDRNQAVDGDVLVEVATLIASRARRAALAANANGNFDDAKLVIQAALSDLRTLAPGDPRILRIIDDLHREELEIMAPMSPMLRKTKHFDAYQVAYSREAGGTARRSQKPR
jgi:hypothetical protein